MRHESWIGVLWAGGMVLAMVLVFFYGLMIYEPERFDLEWSANEHPQEAIGELDAGESAPHTFVVAGTNVTSIRIELRWEDDVGEADTFEVVVSGPADAQDDASAASGALDLNFPLAAVPAAGSTEGPNVWEAMAAIDRDPDPWSGEAAWNVTVRLLSAPGIEGTPAGINDQPDDSNGYTLRLVAVTHDATMHPIG